MKIWATSHDNSIHYVSLTMEYFQGALNVLRKCFYQKEPICFAVGLYKNEAAMDEMDDFVKAVSKEGVSLIALDKTTNVVCGVAFNKLQVLKGNYESTDFDKYFNIYKQKPTREIIKYMDVADSRVNLFDKCQVDCILEIMYLSILPSYGKRGIALELCKASMQLSEDLKNGLNVKQAIDGGELPLEPIPKALSAIFTGPFSQRIGEKLNWKIAVKLGYDDFYTDGKSFSSLLPQEYRFAAVEYFKI